jgi:hypothetical protein
VKKIILGAFLLCALHGRVAAFSDSLRIMSYNVLYYGNGCQGPNADYHQYLQTIVRYANPDVIALVKAASVPVSKNDRFATAPQGFTDSILQQALNKAFPGRYQCAAFTNASRSTNEVLLFFDSSKLGYSGLVSSYANIIDFNTHKLWYKGQDATAMPDTTFLYLTLNHDKSGDDMIPVRGEQIMGEVKELRKHFKRLPNFIDLGDFNLRGSDEPLYQLLTKPADTNFRFNDPPFFPDHSLKYPAAWDHDAAYAAYFTTSTREFDGIPNSCGSAGGAKGWYDHIFLSDWLVRGTNHMRYVSHSYHTIGNDGQHYRVGINNKNGHGNNAAPAPVIEALYRMSNKYPVMLTLEVNSALGSSRLPDPAIAGAPVFFKETPVLVEDTLRNKIKLRIPALMLHQELNVECIDASGQSQFKKPFVPTEEDVEIKCTFKPGNYILRIIGEHNLVAEYPVIKVRPE